MSSFLQDLRYALRMLGRSPVFTAAAGIILALGVGFNTAVFSLVDSVVLRPLPGVAKPAELFKLKAGRYSVFAYPSYRDLREKAIFPGLAAWSNRALGLAGGDGRAERIRATVVSANYFDVLGVRPARGRFLLPREDESGEAVAVLSHGLWQRRFGGAAGAVGASVVLNGVPFTIVGVAPPGFRGAGFGNPGDLWIPIGAWSRVATGVLARLDYHRRTWGWMSIFGRLPGGIGAARAAASLQIAAAREKKEFPTDVPQDYRITMEPLSRAAAGAGHPADPARFLAFLFAAVGAALLVACANLANLLLARALARRREIAVRQALGAGRGRLVRQLLTESLALALFGGASGLVVANWTLSLLSSAEIPGGLTLADFQPSLDLRVLGFAAAISAATALFFGLFPALQATRVAVVPALNDEAAARSRRGPLPGALVAAQVALCLLLLTTGGLLVRSLRNALSIDVGFEPRGVAIASVHLGLARYDGARAWSFAVEAARRAAGLASAKSAAWAGILPLSGGEDTESVELAGAPPGQRQSVAASAVGPGYFKTIGLPIVAGREFDATDTPDGSPVVVVNEAAARRFWPGASAIGRRLRIYGAERTVVGVARDNLFLSLRDAHLPLVTAAIQQLGGDGVLGPMTLLVRGAGDPHSLLPQVRAEIARLDASHTVFDDRTLEESIADELLPQRFGSALIGLFAFLTLVLAAVGIYAVVSASVERRVREIGIRLALGARPGELRRMILAQSAAPVLLGLAAGVPLAFVGARVLGRFLYGVTPTDTATFAAAALVLVLSGVAAADIPARRASRLHPMAALRHE